MIYRTIQLPYRTTRWVFNNDYELYPLPPNVSEALLPQACRVEVGETYTLITALPKRGQR